MVRCVCGETINAMNYGINLHTTFFMACLKSLDKKSEYKKSSQNILRSLGEKCMLIVSGVSSTVARTCLPVHYRSIVYNLRIYKTDGKIKIN